MIPDNLYRTYPTPFSSSSSSQSQSQSQSQSASSPPAWTRLQDKQFEKALVIYPEETPNRWEKIASRVPGKTALEIEKHYQDLVDDINAIEAGLIELPAYVDDDLVDQISFSSKTKGSEPERRRGTPWTEEEHKLFLIGLQKYGRGDWRSISRNAVVSRTPTQVASHAQKYFQRMRASKEEKKRSSIHDITVDDSAIVDVNNQNGTVPVNDPAMNTLSSQVTFPIDQTTILPVNSSSQQAMGTLNSQVLFPNHHELATGYQSYGFPM